MLWLLLPVVVVVVAAPLRCKQTDRDTREAVCVFLGVEAMPLLQVQLHLSWVGVRCSSAYLQDSRPFEILDQEPQASDSHTHSQDFFSIASDDKTIGFLRLSNDKQDNNSDVWEDTHVKSLNACTLS